MNWCDIIVVGCDRMVKFVKSKSMKIEVLENQEKFLSNQEKIKNSLNEPMLLLLIFLTIKL